MALLQKICLLIAGLAWVAAVCGYFFMGEATWQPALVIASVSTAVGIAAIPALAGYQFTLWIIAAVAAAMVYPAMFLSAGPFEVGNIRFPEIDFRNPWIVLVIVQLVMFGMGTKMSLRDFVGVAKMPYPVLIGVALQFVVMPLTGYTLAKLFGFPPEIAAGVVLIGSCSSGLASNVMCYLAGANLALSITLTAVATLLAPLATPFWMQTLAGEFVEVDPVAMMIQIVKIVIVPIGAAMLHDYLKHAAPRRRRGTIAVAFVVAAAALGAGLAIQLGTDPKSVQVSPAVGEALIIFGAAILFALSYHTAATRWAWIENKVHLLSMVGIVYFTTVTTAAGRDHLLVAGAALLAAAVIHNLVGYTLGYGMSRVAGLDRESAITVAFEVGMQNGGMASGLASFLGKLGTVGLAAAVFSPWMNVSGSVLANIIKRFKNNSTIASGESLHPRSMDENENVAGV